MIAKIIHLEGRNDIEKDIRNVIDNVSRNGVMLLLSELADSLPFDPMPIIIAWMDLSGKNIS